MRKKADILCQQVLEEKRIRLNRINFRDTFAKNNGYAVDESGNVTGLNLSGQMLKEAVFLKDFETLQWLDLSKNMISDISILKYLKNLTKLNLNQNRITDITCLKELKKLTWLDLTDNRISMLPGDILGWGMEIKWKGEHQRDIVLEGNPLEESLKHAIEGGRKAIGAYFDIYSDEEKPLAIEEGEALPGRGRSNGARKKILILAANPIRTDRLRLDEEVREIEERLQLSKHRDQFEIHSRWAVRLGDLRKALLDHEPQIVHFIGHGEKNGLIVEDKLGFSVLFPAKALSELFSFFSNQLECVILSACHSAHQAEAINRHIHYVVGMQREIRDKASIEFAVGFYDALGAGKSFEEAFRFGRNAILETFPDETQHLIPVLRKGDSSGGSLITSRSMEVEYRDVFLSHASEDREHFVKPFAKELEKRGITYWLDEAEIKGGDNFVKAINDALGTSRFVVVFLSKNFIGKKWPERELFSSIEKEIRVGQPTLIPIFIAPEKDILYHYQLLSDVSYIRWDGASDTAEALARSIRTNNTQMKYTEVNFHSMKILKSTAISESLLNWCLEAIFSDQYENGGTSGAWSKKYSEYLNILCNGDDSNIRDSITFSSWIADALLNYQSHCGSVDRAKKIQLTIDRFYCYLLKHYESKIGGFGIVVPYSSGEQKIVFDIRHTAWALLALNRIGKGDRETDKMIRTSCNRFAEELEKLNIQDELPVTNSVLHRLLSNENVMFKIFTNQQIVRRKLKLLELSLIQHFNASYYCWGWFNDHTPKMSIDNALSVMYNMNYHSIMDEELKIQFKSVLDHLLDEAIIEFDGETAALPFQKGGDADLGTTILFLYVLKKVSHKWENTSRLEKLFNFINDPESIRKHTNRFSFPWHLAAVFYLTD